MSESNSDQSEKSFEPTPEKLRKAREKGEVARSADLSVAASYAGLLIVLIAMGSTSILSLGTALMALIRQPGLLSAQMFQGTAETQLRGILWHSIWAVAPWFLVPALAVILIVLAQQAFLFTPSKLTPKLSRISLLSNARQKFGRNGLFEFFKSFAKLALFSAGMAWFFRNNLSDILALAGTDAAISVQDLARLGIRFLGLATLIATAIAVIDAFWQYFELRRRNMMTRQEVLDEAKSSEGDPHMKQKRRQKGQEIALNQMMADVPDADVVVVNPTHFAVALKWSRLPGSAPVCVAKGTDEVAFRIRESATAAGVPLHQDAPTARALYASTRIGAEVDEAYYPAVAAAIRFADQMRLKSKERNF